MSAPLVVGAVVVILGGCAGLVLLLRRRARRRRPRMVEAPNSHYESRGVRNLVDRDRWEAIRLERLHEVNREEVCALLARIRESGVSDLAPSERAFLDRMVEAFGTTAPRRGGRTDRRSLPGGLSSGAQPG